jgi:hypothetical protein
VASTTGQNRGLFDRIGDESVFAVDSSVDGRVNFGFDAHHAWPASGSYGVVVYIDSRAGGFASTKDLHDTADLSRRLVSGRGTSGERADLYFAPGFEADYAVCLTADQARIYELGMPSHTLVGGANLGTPVDLDGGHEVAYHVGLTDDSMREVEARLSHFGVGPGGSFNLVATLLLDGDTAYRTNEFVGVSPGNTWDTANLAASSATIKYGDFVRFSAALRKSDADGDDDVDLTDFNVFADCLGGPGAPPGAMEPTPCLRAMDADIDGDVDLTDFANFAAAMSVMGD